MGQFVHFDIYLFEICCLFRELEVTNQTQNQRCPSIEHNIANFHFIAVGFIHTIHYCHNRTAQNQWDVNDGTKELEMFRALST